MLYKHTMTRAEIKKLYSTLIKQTWSKTLSPQVKTQKFCSKLTLFHVAGKVEHTKLFSLITTLRKIYNKPTLFFT